MKMIDWQDFTQVELRVGTIIKAEEFTKARKPAYIVYVDFGDELGIKKTSAQITELYGLEELVGLQIVGVVNFPKKQIGPIQSEFLLTGFHTNEGVVIAIPDKSVTNGAKLC